MPPLALVALVALAALAPAQDPVDWPAGARIITVAPDGSADHTSITPALAAAEDGTIIDIAPGEYVESLVIRKSVWLRATPGAVRVRAATTQAVALTIARVDDARITGVLCTTAGAPWPGTIPATATIEVRDSRVRFDSAGVVGSPVGGLRVLGESMTVLESCLVAAVSGIGVVVEGPARVRMVDCDVRHIGHVGVESRTGAEVELTSCRLLYAEFHGLRIHGSTPIVQRSWFEGNERSQIYFDTDSPATITGNVFIGAGGPASRAQRAGATYGGNSELDAAPDDVGTLSPWPPQPEEGPWIRRRARRAAVEAGPSDYHARKLSMLWCDALRGDDHERQLSALQAIQLALWSDDELLRLAGLTAIPSIPAAQVETFMRPPASARMVLWPPPDARTRVLEATRSPHGVVQREAFRALAHFGLLAGDRERLIHALEAHTPGFDISVALLNAYFDGDLTGRAAPLVNELLREAGSDDLFMAGYGFEGARITPEMETRLFELVAAQGRHRSADSARCYALAQLAHKSERVLEWLARESQRDDIDVSRLAYFVRKSSTEAEVARVLALGGRLPEDTSDD